MQENLGTQDTIDKMAICIELATLTYREILKLLEILGDMEI